MQSLRNCPGGGSYLKKYYRKETYFNNTKEFLPQKINIKLDCTYDSFLL